MLQIKHIRKEYRTGKLVQKALDDVSLNLRDNEFVAILGPSGSGKTTLLNIVGGLDRYDSGDLIINGISTKKPYDRIRFSKLQSDSTSDDSGKCRACTYDFRSRKGGKERAGTEGVGRGGTGGTVAQKAEPAFRRTDAKSCDRACPCQ